MIAMAALALDDEQPGAGEPGEMAAGRLRGNVGRTRELGRGERTAVHQGGEDVGARRVADQGRGGGQRCGAGHALLLGLAAKPAPYTAGRGHASAEPVASPGGVTG